MSFFQGRAVGAVVSLGIALAGQVFSQNSAGGLGPMTVSLEREEC